VLVAAVGAGDEYAYLAGVGEDTREDDFLRAVRVGRKGCHGSHRDDELLHGPNFTRDSALKQTVDLLVEAVQKEYIMSIRAYVVALLVATAAAIGCESRSSMPVSPSSSDQGQTLSVAAPGAPRFAAAVHQHTVTLSDACDPDTFNDPITGVGPGTCLRPGGVRFQDFINELMQHHSIGGWHMAPGEVTMQVGDVLSAFNQGGEEHTFTEVEEYGGGVNSTLNAIIGLTTVAPECNENSIERLKPGQSSHETELEEGVEKYQCCIHPWMRTVVHKVER
jgi:hypothetical protein